MQPSKRLHISPLNSTLLPAVLPGPLLEKATNISFHTIQTFPEKAYGYVELPGMEAEKLKRKLHGYTLKGAKMQVEEARPKKHSKRHQDQTDQTEEANNPEKKKRKRKTEDDTIPGHELDDRKVKRGWTEPTGEMKESKRHKDKAKRNSSSKAPSLTDKSECLFQTNLPPNKATSTGAKEGKAKKRKRTESTRNVVVHEFENTTKHANFLRDEPETNGKRAAAEFVEGKGWIDADGKIVDVAPKGRKSKSKADNGVGSAVEEKEKPRSRRSSRLEAASVKLEAPGAVAEEQTSSSGSSLTSDDDDDTELVHDPLSFTGKAPEPQNLGHKESLDINGDDVGTRRVERLSITRSSATPPPQQGSPTSAAVKEVHPLEALFKRPMNAASHTPKKPNLEVATSFSFFDPDEENGQDQGLAVPQTPFTQQDLRQRRQRSAAPTPDTAAVGKTFGDIWEGTSDISDGEDGVKVDAEINDKNKSATPDIKQEKPESEFSKWFWEHRGENNRAWKRRRREAAKEKRQRENKDRRG